MTIFCTGDIHGKVIERFSFKQHPELRQLKKEDIIFQLGDFGQPFGLSTYKEAEYIFKFLNEKPWITIIIGGNHDDYDYWQSCPQVKLFNGKARQAIFNGKSFSVFFIDEITILNINNYNILCIPCAESHDADILLNPNESNFKYKQASLRKQNQWFRIIGHSWWPQEKMNIQENAEFIEHHMNKHFDFILTHDAPALINSWFKRSNDITRRKSTAGQLFLEELRKNLNFNTWFHGHFHFTGSWNKIYDDRMCGLYHEIIQLSNEKTPWQQYNNYAII